MKKKGQALVEFVLILPIFIMLILSAVDIGTIFYNKIILEEQIGEAITLYENGEAEETIKTKLKLDNEKIILSVSNNNDYLDFELKKNLEIITPGLNLIFDNPYNLTVKRSIPNE